jgi:Domain of unknown function (DUF3597)
MRVACGGVQSRGIDRRQSGEGEMIMSIFGNIVSKIFPHHTPGASAAVGTAPSTTVAAAPGAAATGAGKPMSRFELEIMIQKIADAEREKYEWKHSIVDLMKLLKLDSSLNARKQLAQELGYKGALDGSADMNIWLHQQVMTKVAEGGGKVPDSLKA